MKSITIATLSWIATSCSIAKQNFLLTLSLHSEMTCSPTREAYVAMLIRVSGAYVVIMQMKVLGS